ncbi:MAG: histidine kinase dimerization/phospho-acceptor domain-containing protein, partial [Pseudomonadota bacterium]
MIGRENTVAGVDLTTIRVDQARLLRQNALQSCLIVEGVIVFYALVIGFVASWQYAALWTLGASIMVLVSFIHSRIAVKGEITEENHRQYLFSHILVCATTGAVWAGFAIGLIEFDSSISIVFACFLATAITLGGILPSSEYRPGFIALATTDHLPLAVYILLAGSGPFRLLGLGMLMFYAFCMYASARSELDTRDSIVARNMTSLNQQLLQKNADIERAAEEKSRFLAATSHDLSQPLHAQGLLIQALKSRLTRPDQIDLLERIERSWQNQNSILRGLVDVTKLDNGVIIPRPRPFSFAVSLNSSTIACSSTTRSKGR